MNKAYIGREEAFELALERGFFALPRKGREYVNVPSNTEIALNGAKITALGKDERGYYLAELAS